MVIGLLLLAYCATRPSALNNPHQFAQMPYSSSFDAQEVRSALLRLVPVGTSEAEVYQFL